MALLESTLRVVLYPARTGAAPEACLIRGFSGGRNAVRTLSRAAIRRRRPPPRTVLLERDLEHLVDLVDPVELDVLLERVGELLEVRLVLLRRDHALDAEALGGDRLLAQAADRQHAPGEGDPPGHRSGGADAPPGGGRPGRGPHRDAPAGAVLGPPPRRDMHVQVVGAEPVLVDRLA